MTISFQWHWRRLLPIWGAAVAILVSAPAGVEPTQAPLDAAALRREARAVIESVAGAAGAAGNAPLQPLVRSREEGEGLLWERVTFMAEPAQTVPTLTVRLTEASGRLPAVVVLHGLGGSKDRVKGFMEELARRGYLALAIDARWHGERGPGLQDAMIRAYRVGRGHPYVYDTVYDLFRTLDYLETRPDVDPERIGMIGFSMGGQETWITAALDYRVRVAVPAIGVNGFDWTIQRDRWRPRASLLPKLYEAVRTDLGEVELNARVFRAAWDRLTPGLMDRFDGPRLLPLIAPRPLLILNGETDPLVPIEGARLAAENARRAYEAAGFSDRFRFDVAAGVGHAVTPEQRRLALDWFDRWLQPGERSADAPEATEVQR